MNEPKYFLLTAGDYHYPMSGDEDWIQTYPSREAAEKEVRRVRSRISRTIYLINKQKYDWYEVIDLRDWIWRDKNNE
jgi:hypothetical protein